MNLELTLNVIKLITLMCRLDIVNKLNNSNEFYKSIMKIFLE